MNKRPRNDEGATLAFVAAAAIIVILVGVGFFVLSRMLGGGREAQSATDSGNLNVAKQALITPAVDVGSLATYPTGANASILKSEFSGLVSGSQVNLENYNRLVGKALLIALNAAEEDAMGATNADANAAKFAQWVQGPDSVGEALAIALSNGNNSSNAFQAVANANSVRMLKQNNVSNNTAEHSVSYMRQNANVASNVFIDQNSVPASVYNQVSSKLKNENGMNFVVGYTPITVGNTTLQAVPMRPGQQPHLVALSDFKDTTAQQPPVAGASVAGIPPNAFESGSLANEGFRGASTTNLDTRSAAIVGSPDMTVGKGTFPASIPHGVIIVYDNYGTVQSTTGINGQAGAAAGVLMHPSFVAAANDGGTNYISTVPGEDPTSTNPPYSHVTPTPPSSWFPQQVTDPNTGQTSTQPGHPPTFSNCDNYSTYSGSSAYDPTCGNALPSIESYYGGPGNTNPGSYNGLMEIEALKAEIVAVRGTASGSIGCGHAQGGGLCSPLKVYNTLGTVGHSDFPQSSGPFTVGNLLNQANWQSNPTIVSQVVERMVQMNPSTSPAAAQAALQNLSSSIYFGGGPYYIYYDSSVGNYVFSATAPSSAGVNWLSNTSPDGPSTPIYAVHPTPANDVLVDQNGDGGYPHPFDCPPPLSVTSNDKVFWTPSSGFGNLMGVLNFGNCATGGGNWCCPC